MTPSATRESLTHMSTVSDGHARTTSRTYRHWIVATTLGELAAFSVPAATWGLCAVAGLGDLPTAIAVIASGACEGAILGWAQSRVLRVVIPGLDARPWIRATAAGAVVAWALGMIPSTFQDTLAHLPIGVLVAAGVVGAITMLCSIGVAQARVLRRHVHGARGWVVANVLGWLAGLAWRSPRAG